MAQLKQYECKGCQKKFLAKFKSAELVKKDDIKQVGSIQIIRTKKGGSLQLVDVNGVYAPVYFCCFKCSLSWKKSIN